MSSTADQDIQRANEHRQAREALERFKLKSKPYEKGLRLIAATGFIYAIVFFGVGIFFSHSVEGSPASWVLPALATLMIFIGFMALIFSRQPMLSPMGQLVKDLENLLTVIDRGEVKDALELALRLQASQVMTRIALLVLRIPIQMDSLGDDVHLAARRVAGGVIERQVQICTSNSKDWVKDVKTWAQHAIRQLVDDGDWQGIADGEPWSPPSASRRERWQMLTLALLLMSVSIAAVVALSAFVGGIASVIGVVVAGPLLWWATVLLKRAEYDDEGLSKGLDLARSMRSDATSE